MKQLPVLSGKEILKALKTSGFVEISQRGSHVKLRRFSFGGTKTVIIPLHEELAPGTLKSILRQAGLTAEDLWRLLEN
jgi:predicted RNA binding protein YcfA (HicA-like mRNA interferase family)